MHAGPVAVASSSIMALKQAAGGGQRRADSAVASAAASLPARGRRHQTQQRPQQPRARALTLLLTTLLAVLVIMPAAVQGRSVPTTNDTAAAAASSSSSSSESPAAAAAASVLASTTCGMAAFQDYVHEFEKKYSGPAEFDTRFAAWRKSCLFVEQYKQEHPDAAFQMALNHLSDRTEAEHKTLFGGLKLRTRELQQRQRQQAVEAEAEAEVAEPQQQQEQRASPSWATRLLQGFRKRERSEIREVDPNDLDFGPPIEPRALPQTVDWRTPSLNPTGVVAVTPVKNQGLCGACWAFSTAAAVEGAVAVLTGYLNEVSVQEMIDCVKQNDGCNGGDFDYAFTFAAQRGLASYSDYRFIQGQAQCRAGQFPVVSRIANGYATSQCRPNDLMDKVVQRPVAVAIDGSCDAFVHYSGGIFTASCGRDLNHAVVIVGYGTDAATGAPYWLIKNSWGKRWGHDGYGKVARGVGSCGVSQIEEYGYYAVGGTAFVNGTAIFSEDELANQPRGSFLERLLQWKYITVVLGIAIAFFAFPILLSCLRSLARCCCGGGGNGAQPRRRPQPVVVPVAGPTGAGGGGGRSPTGARHSPTGGSGYPGAPRAKTPPGSGGGGGHSPRASSPPPSAPPAPTGSEWSCASCTFLNPPHKRMCQICGNYRLA